VIEKPLNVYIGLDKNIGATAAAVCEKSIRAHASIPVSVTMLDQDWLRAVGLYHRQFYVENSQFYDARDSRPFSTQFSFTRFLTPSLQPSGWALFMDSDFMFRADIADLAALFDDQYSLMCVKHQYAPTDKTKMAGQLQQNYDRKNWSSLMAFNCDRNHVTPFQVNSQPGSWLHQMRWLADSEIGEFPETWNWLDGHSKGDNPKVVHHTRGTPDLPGWEDVAYADEWRAYSGD
jgi:hypothetical protein